MAALCKSGRLAVNGGHLAYRLYEGGARFPWNAPIVLAAGWGSVMNDWYALPEELARLGRTVLLCDNRGIGESSGHGGAIGVEEYAADVVALAEAVLRPPGRPFVVVGHSSGAFVAQHLAVHSPGRIVAAVLLGGQGARATADQGAAAFFKLGRKTFHDGSDLPSRKALLSYFIDATAKDVLSKEFEEICKRSLDDNRPQATIDAQLRMLAKADYGPRLGEIRCPVLVLHGREDAVIPLTNAERLHGDLSGSALRRLIVAPGPHFFFAPSREAAARIAAHVVEFLGDCEGLPSKL